ncbi:MAG: hypothetical protein LBJ62_07180 [Bifidobacteriaceae bacterium]|jgi:hypothetical protein|nr:hypothetical protein [Bifidobacteriaceae bacterium]
MISQELRQALDNLTPQDKRDVIVYLQTGASAWSESLTLDELADLVQRIEAVFADEGTARSLEQEFDRTPVGAEWKETAEAARRKAAQQVTIHELRRLIRKD